MKLSPGGSIMGAAIAAVVAATAVGASVASAAGAAPFNSCSVVTSAEASAALGQSTSSGTLGHALVEGGLACVFYGPKAPTPHNPDVGQTDTVRVVVVKGTNAAKWYDTYKGKVHPVTVSGYGQHAYWDGAASFNVLSGSYYVRIAVVPFGAAPSEHAAEALAKAILPHLH